MVDEEDHEEEVEKEHDDGQHEVGEEVEDSEHEDEDQEAGHNVDDGKRSSCSC